MAQRTIFNILLIDHNRKEYKNNKYIYYGPQTLSCTVEINTIL